MSEQKNLCDLKDITLVVMSLISQISAICICVFLITHPPDMKDATFATVIGTIVGFVISEAKGWSTYWTGSNRNSNDKDKAIASIANTAPPVATTINANTINASADKIETPPPS